MKNTLIIILLIGLLGLFPCSIHAQLNKNSILSGIQFGGRNTSSKSEYPRNNNTYENRYTDYRPGLEFNYFIYDNLSVGLSGSYFYSEFNYNYLSNGNKTLTNGGTGGLHVTKYIPINKQFQTYLGLYYENSHKILYQWVYQNKVETNYYKTYVDKESIGLNIGMLLFFSKRWAVKLDISGIDWQSQTTKADDERSKATEKGWNSSLDATVLTIGLSYLFNSKNTTEKKSESK